MRSFLKQTPSLVLRPETLKLKDQRGAREGRQEIDEVAVHSRRRSSAAFSHHSFLSVATICLLFLLLVQQGQGASAQVEDDDDYYASYEADEDEEIVPDTRVVESRKKRGSEESGGSGGAGGAYYDFVISEFSYKLWAAFMIYDMILTFYACLVSAYFGQVNTLAPSPSYDYDYLAKRSASGVDEEVIHAPPPSNEMVLDRVLMSISSTSSPYRLKLEDGRKGGRHTKRFRKT